MFFFLVKKVFFDEKSQNFKCLNPVSIFYAS
jgi:hypothetical protein